MTTQGSIEAILETARGFMGTEIILAAHELHIFDHIGDSYLTACDVSARSGVNERGMTILLDALVALSLLQKDGDLYANTAEGRCSLCRNGSDFKGATLDHIAGMREIWRRLPDAVRTGTTVRKAEESLVLNRKRNRAFIRAMNDCGSPNGAVIAERLDLSGYHHLLDLGGGPGSYAMALLRKNPQMRATIVDLPLTLEVAEEVIAEAGMTDRIDLRSADFFGDDSADIGNGYDLALLSNILHIEGASKNLALLKRVFSAMTSPGMIIIHEAIIGEDRTSPPDRAIFAVNMLVHTERGNCYTFEEMKGWLEEAGFTGIVFVDCFDRPSLLAGYKR